MLRELWISIRTQCAPARVALGYRYAAVACVSRAERCRRAWAPHQQQSRQAILAAMQDVAPNRHTALILGSGPCLDVPMPELLTRFTQVLLVDVAHPPAARRLARENAAITLCQADLTGVASFLIDGASPALPTPYCDLYCDRNDIGLVVSANLVSQLPLVPMRHAGKRWGAGAGPAFAAAIVKAHLDHLNRFNCPTLLIGDVERQLLDEDRQIREIDDPLWGVTLPPGTEWSWHVAPLGELRGNWSMVNRVRAVRLDR